MATLLFVPQFLPLPTSSSSSSFKRSPQRYGCCCMSASLPAAKHSGRNIGSEGQKLCGPAIVWFKNDLRIDDHLGLVAASKHPMVVPLYVFDRRILSSFSDEMLELVLLAVKDLRESLKEQGSNLMIRFGYADYVIPQLVKEVKATNIYAEEEVEYNLRLLVDFVKEKLVADSFLDWSPDVTSWYIPFYNVKNLEDLPTWYKFQFSDVSPCGASKLPRLHSEVDWGCLPSIDDLRNCTSNSAGMVKRMWASTKETSAEAVLQNEQINIVKSSGAFMKELRLSESGGNNQNSKETPNKKQRKSVFVTSKGNVVAGGTKAVLNALAAYLRYMEGTARDDWQEVHQKLRQAESRAGASFNTLFGPALQVGIISRRRAYYEAIKYEKERNAGFLSPFGYSTFTVAAVIDTVCSMEWYWLLALKSQLSNDNPYSIRIWRWNGHLIQYTVAGHEGPPVLLVHGFGAFLEHYRDNFYSIADSGNRVWAITLLGFGKSEKPNVVYTELMWGELLRDFIVDVVGEPVHLIGNSIGGYLAAIVAGLWPSLTKSIVLINSAGDVVPGYKSLVLPKERKVSGAAWLGARMLLQYLRLNIRSLVKNCYPTRPERADDWLINEMIRASHDPNCIVVLESVFSFNLAIPLNHLLARLKEKVLVVQGMKDPIADPNSKVAMLREHCPGITIKELDAGHCPHDECPELLNAVILDWIVETEGRSCAEEAKYSETV